MRANRLFALTLFGTALLALLSAGVATAAEAPPTVQPALASPSPVPANCGLGIALPGAAAIGETCSATEPESVLPDFISTSKRLGYCHCGCVFQRVCRTSADCGGASCDQSVSCC